MAFIYMLLDNDDQPYYVGKTLNMSQRRRNHLTALRKGSHLKVYNKMRKLMEAGHDLIMQIS